MLHCLQALYSSSKQTIWLLQQFCREPAKNNPPGSPVFDPSTYVVGNPLLIAKMEELLQLSNFLGTPVLQARFEEVNASLSLRLTSWLLTAAAADRVCIAHPSRCAESDCVAVCETKLL